MRDRLAAIPGVTAVSFADNAPLEYGANEATFVENEPSGQLGGAPIRRLKLVAAGLLAAVGTPMVTGRDITWDDIHQHRPVVMVSENFAREYWRTPDAALGKRIGPNPTSPSRAIVGVAADIHDDGMQRPAPPIVYWPVLMENFWGNRINVPRGVTFVIRSSLSRHCRIPGGGSSRRSGPSTAACRSRAGQHAGRAVRSFPWRRPRSRW